MSRSKIKDRAALEERISGMVASGEPDLVVWGYDEKGPA